MIEIQANYLKREELVSSPITERVHFMHTLSAPAFKKVLFQVLKLVKLDEGAGRAEKKRRLLTWRASAASLLRVVNPNRVRKYFMGPGPFRKPF